MKRLRRLLGLWLLVGCTGTASAAVAYNNFGPGDSFDAGIGWTIGPFTQGSQFTALTSGALTDVYVAFFYFGQGADLTLRLHADLLDSPGALLETLVIDDSEVTAEPAIEHVSASGSTLLVEGATYWLLATSDEGYAWNHTDPVVSGRHYFDGAFSTETQGAFRLEVSSSSVPAPATLALFAVALAGLGFSRRRCFTS